MEALAGGQYFPALRATHHHEMGALGPPEIVAFTDAAALAKQPKDSELDSRSARQLSAMAADLSKPHKDVDRVIRKELLTNATHHHIYAAAAMADGAALNRLAKFASSEALLVVRGGAEAEAGPAHSPTAQLNLSAYEWFQGQNGSSAS